MSGPQIVNCVQGSPEWWQARLGIPTASNFAKLITPKTGKLSSQAFMYACELVAEEHDGAQEEQFGSFWMDRGAQLEPEAADFYAFETGRAVDRVGIVLNDGAGASPDRLVGDSGLLEIKCPSPKVHISYLVGGTLPDAYRPQVHGQMLIAERDWCDFLSYCPNYRPFLIRVVRDEYTDAVRTALKKFLHMLADCRQAIFTTGEKT